MGATSRLARRRTINEVSRDSRPAPNAKRQAADESWKSVGRSRPPSEHRPTASTFVIPLGRDGESGTGQAGCGSHVRDSVVGIQVQDGLPPATDDREAAAPSLVAPQVADAVGARLAAEPVPKHDSLSRVPRNANGNRGCETAIPLGRPVCAVRNRAVSRAADCDSYDNADGRYRNTHRFV
jgi:hypothetical protein